MLVTTSKIFNKVALSFTFTIELNLLKPLADGVNLIKTRLDIDNLIAFMQMNSKFHYIKKHQLIVLAVGDYSLF